VREGQAKVLSERELSRVVNVVKKKAHAKRNAALLYCSFGLGLRAKEMAALKVRHVLGVDGNMLEEINLTGAMTKGGKQRHAYLTNPKVVSAIRDFINDRQKREGILFNLEAPLFKSQKGGSFSPNSLQQLFHRMYLDAKLQGAYSGQRDRSFRSIVTAAHELMLRG
jgi:integrase/recombinase XerD